MQLLFILHDPPYGSERPYQALRLAMGMLKMEDDLDLTVYLTADAVLCAKRGQQTPQGYYNLERMLRFVARRGNVMACRTCLEARGVADDELLEGVIRARLGDQAQLALEADQVLIY